MRADWPAICRGVSYWEDTRSAGGGHCSKRIIYGNRDGIDYYGSSVVALDARSGKLRWHFQTVHHDVWDWDLPCAPIIADIVLGGRTISAIAQPSKQGFVFVLDRATGEPVWPIEERAVPEGDVPGEWYAATQPFPTKPPPFERQGVSLDDLIDFTPPALKSDFSSKSTSRLSRIESSSLEWKIACSKLPVSTASADPKA